MFRAVVNCRGRRPLQPVSRPGPQPVSTERPSVLRRVVLSLIAARETTAAHLPRRHLALYSDAELLSAGHSPEDIAEIRRRVGT